MMACRLLDGGTCWLINNDAAEIMMNSHGSITCDNSEMRAKGRMVNKAP